MGVEPIILFIILFGVHFHASVLHIVLSNFNFHLIYLTLRPLHPLLFRPQHSHVCTSLKPAQCFLCALHLFGTAYMSHKWTLANPTLDSVVTSWQKRLPRFRKTSSTMHTMRGLLLSTLSLRLLVKKTSGSGETQQNPTAPSLRLRSKTCNSQHLQHSLAPSYASAEPQKKTT